MSDVRTLLEQFPVPPQPRTFFDDLWELVQTREHARAVRWRRISIALAGIALAAVAAAGVLAAPHGTPAFDQTVTCTLEEQGGIPVVAFQLRAKEPREGSAPYFYTLPAQVQMATGGQKNLFVVQSDSKGYILAKSECADASGHGALSTKGLTQHTTIVQGRRYGVEVRCLGPARVTVRIRLQQDARGFPKHVVLRAVATRTGRPLIDLDWSPAVLRESSSPRCQTEDY